jgi:hypothetical protein
MQHAVNLTELAERISLVLRRRIFDKDFLCQPQRKFTLSRRRSNVGVLMGSEGVTLFVGGLKRGPEFFLFSDSDASVS